MHTECQFTLFKCQASDIIIQSGWDILDNNCTVTRREFNPVVIYLHIGLLNITIMLSDSVSLDVYNNQEKT